jgi:hypothetical protein
VITSKRAFPPSLNRVPGMSDADLKEEEVLLLLGEAIRGLSPGEENDLDPSAPARSLYEDFRIAKLAARQKQKAGKASFTSIAKQMKDVASGSRTLLKRLEKADRNVFDVWVRAAEETSHVAAPPAEKWLLLRSLLNETAARATRAAQIAEADAKACPEAKGAKGRPEDVVARAITVKAADIYEGWTGKIAVRSISRDDGSPGGEFHDFVTQVFGILSISASPDYSNDRLQKELAKLQKR